MRRGDSLAWALVPTIRSATRDLVLVQRREGQWSYELVPTGNAVDADLSYSDSLGLLLAVVQADRRLMSDGNSLLLWAQRPEWRILHRLVHGEVDGRVYEPRLRRGTAGLVTSWRTPVGAGPQTQEELRAMIGRLDAETPPVVVLDPDVSVWSEYAPLVQVQELPVWVTHHAESDGSSGKIRFVGVAGDSAVALGGFENPYKFRGAAVASAASELLVTGMEYLEDDGFAFSLLLRARVECSGPP